MIAMRLPPLVRAQFLQRDNRFRATVRLDGSPVAAHVANPGRCAELLVPGRTIWLERATSTQRKTPYTLALVEHDGVLVSMRSYLANDLLAEALAEGELLGEYQRLEREVARGRSRFDFLLHGPAGDCWVEAKSVTLVEQGVALFPDAPTARGRRHLLELAELAAEGTCAAVVFVIQRPDAVRFAPHVQNDPELARALRRAAQAGVRVYAFRCEVSLEEVRLAGPVPIALDGIT
ncbi:MAG: DNA/RNA nuclease SfsA [Anaerolineae bacterium]|nr:DNA/RNA nuclease SfsA [Anaerolineae bacterium]